MVAFDLLITIIESLILASFIMMALNSIPNSKPIIVLTIIFTIETTFFNSVYINNFLLLLIEISSALIILYFHSRKISFYQIFILLLGVAFILLSNVISIFVFTFFFGLDISHISSNIVLYICVIITSKILNLLMCILAFKFLSVNNNNLELKKWWLFLMFLSTILIMMIIILESLIFGIHSIHLSILLLVLLSFLLILAIIIYMLINNENKKQLELARQVIKNEYLNKNYIQMNYLYNATIKERHRMMYLLIKFKNLILSNNKDDLIKSINKELQNMDKGVSLKATFNPYFDYKLRECLQNLKKKGYIVKTIFQFNKIEILNQENIVNQIIEFIMFLAQYSNDKKYISIYITEMREYLIIKIKVSSNEEIIKYDQMINDKFRYELEIQNGYIELNLLIKTDY